MIHAFLRLTKWFGYCHYSETTLITVVSRVHDVLTSDFFMGNIYCHVAKEGYAARAQDARSYDAIADILSRWTFPLQ